MGDYRIDRLEVIERRNAGRVRGADWYSLRVSASCPPSKVVQMRGGRVYLGYNSGWVLYDDYEYRAYTVPALSADLADPASVGLDVTFTTANYYQFFLLQLRLPAEVEEPEVGDWSFLLHGTLDEFATAGEAEQWLNSEDFRHSSPWDEGSEGTCFPLCGLVLRNDGQVGVSGAILPVDVVNRGRSYIWPSDMRPRTDIYS